MKSLSEVTWCKNIIVLLALIFFGIITLSTDTASAQQSTTQNNVCGIYCRGVKTCVKDECKKRVGYSCEDLNGNGDKADDCELGICIDGICAHDPGGDIPNFPPYIPDPPAPTKAPAPVNNCPVGNYSYTCYPGNLCPAGHTASSFTCGTGLTCCYASQDSTPPPADPPVVPLPPTANTCVNIGNSLRGGEREYECQTSCSAGRVSYSGRNSSCQVGLTCCQLIAPDNSGDGNSGDTAPPQQPIPPDNSAPAQPTIPPVPGVGYCGDAAPTLSTMTPVGNPTCAKENAQWVARYDYDSSGADPYCDVTTGSAITQYFYRCPDVSAPNPTPAPSANYDIQLPRIEINKSTYSPKESMTATVVIKNNGDAYKGNITVSIFRNGSVSGIKSQCPGDPSQCATKNQTFSVNLSQNEEVRKNVSLNSPPIVSAPDEIGSFTMIAWADSSESIRETNEENNYQSISYSTATSQPSCVADGNACYGSAPCCNTGSVCINNAGFQTCNPPSSSTNPTITDQLSPTKMPQGGTNDPSRCTVVNPTDPKAECSVACVRSADSKCCEDNISCRNTKDGKFGSFCRKPFSSRYGECRN